MLNETVNQKIAAFAGALIDPHQARTIVEPYADEPGFWFGGGNMIATDDGSLYVAGRYRNSGDARTGVGKGTRGLELAIFRSLDGGRSFEKIISFSKNDLNTDGKQVISIEGVALQVLDGSVELFVSSEKSGIDYPAGLEELKKPGTGVWTIDRIEAATVEGLQHAPVEPLIASVHPEFLHLKDPVVHTAGNGDTVLFFCSHPFSWTSSNSAYCIRPSGKWEFDDPVFDFFPRGYTWDVAVSRITDVLSIPGEIFERPEAIQMVFYDGAECIRPHDENSQAVSRPRGYSCEEIAGLAVFVNDRIDDICRISNISPLFISPWGTGCSRYIHTCSLPERVIATWQQSQTTGAQPLVMHSLSWDEIRSIVKKA
ncbi:MAG: hypothetical protein PVH37_17005 [Desulfobacterales bacterium]